MIKCRHHKGKDDELLHKARHSETLEEMVVYRVLYDDHAVWVRPKPMFFEDVTLPDGTKKPRFERIDEDSF